MATKPRKKRTLGRDYAVRMGRKGGKIGGRRRAESLSPERRSEIARAAAAARWKKQEVTP